MRSVCVGFSFSLTYFILFIYYFAHNELFFYFIYLLFLMYAGICKVVIVLSCISYEEKKKTLYGSFCFIFVLSEWNYGLFCITQEILVTNISFWGFGINIPSEFLVIPSYLNWEVGCKLQKLGSFQHWMPIKMVIFHRKDFIFLTSDCPSSRYW